MRQTALLLLLTTFLPIKLSAAISFLMSAGPVWQIGEGVFEDAEISLERSDLYRYPELEYHRQNFYLSRTNEFDYWLDVVSLDGELVRSVDYGAQFAGLDFRYFVVGMEFVSDTLYVSMVSLLQNGPTFRPRPSLLGTMDTVTGAITLLGPTGVDAPMGGLAYDGTTLYGVTSGGEDPAHLYTLDTNTGSASLVGSLGVRSTGLDFDEDKLFSLSSLDRRGNGSLSLFEVNPNTGETTDVGFSLPVVDANLPFPTAITSVPEPECIVLVGLFGVSLGLFRRRLVEE